MATKEDILEQIVEEYLLHQGYFVQHNLKFLPLKSHRKFNPATDSNHSDIDILGFNPRFRGTNRVVAVSCKSWQGGFNPQHWLDAITNNETISGRAAWKGFRELTSPKWSQGFRDTIRIATRTNKFTYVLAVARVVGDATCWTENSTFKRNLGGNPIRIVDVATMIRSIDADIKSGAGRRKATTLAATEVGRILQMFNAAGFDLSNQGSPQ